MIDNCPFLTYNKHPWLRSRSLRVPLRVRQLPERERSARRRLRPLPKGRSLGPGRICPELSSNSMECCRDEPKVCPVLRMHRDFLF
jgi:hypothetical protein